MLQERRKSLTKKSLYCINLKKINNSFPASEAKLITNRAKINKSQAFNDKEVEDLVERLHVTKEELKKIKKDKKELQEGKRLCVIILYSVNIVKYFHVYLLQNEP